MWKGKQNAKILINMLFLPAEVDFYYEHGKSLKLAPYKTVIDTWYKWTNLTT